MVIRTPNAPPVRPDWSALSTDGRPLELVRGRAQEVERGAPETLLANLLKRDLENPVADSDFGWTPVINMPFDLPVAETRRIPHLAVVGYDRWPRGRRIPQGAAWAVAPDLVVEVISPTDIAYEVMAKLQEYFRAGVRQVWVVFPHVGQLYRYRSPTDVRILARADVLTADGLLPDFRLPLADLFPPAEDLPADEG